MNLLKDRLDASGVSDAEAADLRFHMARSPFAKLLEYDIEIAALEETRGLTLAESLEQFHTQKGVVLGLQKALGILKRPASVPPRK